MEVVNMLTESDKYIDGAYVGDLYIQDEFDNIGSLFEKCSQLAKKDYGVQISRSKFIETFMNSHIRKLLDEWHPKLISQAATDTFRAFVEVDLNNKDFHKIQGEDYKQNT